MKLKNKNTNKEAPKIKTTKIATTVSSLVFASLLVAGTAFAHSDHDHSHLPIGWTFDKGVMNKIEKNLERGQKKVGLSSLEQDVLQNYGIREGNSFNTRIGNQMMKVTRTSSGIRVEGQVVAYADGLTENLPIRSQAEVVRSSMGNAHSGHDHGHLKLSWVFHPAIEAKIHEKVSGDRTSNAIGLNSKQQRILERYDIKVGNTFHAYVDGITFTVKRTSSGLNILDQVDGRVVASVPGENNGAY